ncbi:MAG: hypothetical protein KIT22_18985 [Verrucomicrobiae bacterium]|nr:hypothetical protein [Verrucomicrobiae bacterium]
MSLKHLIDSRAGWRESQTPFDAGVRTIPELNHPEDMAFLDHPDRKVVDDAVEVASNRLKGTDWEEVRDTHDYLKTLRSEWMPLCALVRTMRESVAAKQQAARPYITVQDTRVLLKVLTEIHSIEAAVELAERRYIEPMRSEILHLESEILRFIAERGGAAPSSKTTKKADQ